MEWRDTRPARPAGEYLVAGVVFTDGGRATTGEISTGARRLFALLGIVEQTPTAKPKRNRKPRT